MGNRLGKDQGAPLEEGLCWLSLETEGKTYTLFAFP